MRHSYLAAVGVGVLAGMRSLAAPALVSRYLERDPAKPAGTLATFMASSAVSKTLQAGAAAEMAADKTRFVPDRIAWPSLAWRAVSGGLAGSLVTGDSGRSRLLGGLLAAGAAVGATFASYYIRRALHDQLHVPDRLLGAAEDSLVVTGGRRLLLVK